MNDNNFNNQNTFIPNMDGNMGMPTGQPPVTNIPQMEPMPMVQPQPVVPPVMEPAPTPMMEANPQPIMEPIQQPVVTPTPIVEQPVIEPVAAPVVSEPVVMEPQAPAPMVEPMAPVPPVMEPAPTPVVEPTSQPMMNSMVQPTFEQPTLNSIPQPTPNNNEPNSLLKNKTVLIVGGVVLLVIIGLVLYFAVFKKDNKKYSDIDDYYAEQEKIVERINKNFDYKDYKINEGILIELNNKNDEMVNADIKVEFFNEDGAPVDVKTGYVFYLAGKSTGYEKISTYGLKEYAKYTITIKLEDVPYAKSYADKIKFVSNNTNEDDYIFQIKNEADAKIKTVEIGVMFIGPNNSIIDFDTETFNDLNPGETTTGKASIPYDFTTHKNMTYEKVELKVLGAIVNNN